MAGDFDAALAIARQVLTAAQLDAVLGGRDRLVTACPGAGKTRAVGARAAVLAAQKRRVALTSYTNVGAQEMRDALERYFAVRLNDEHFVGTLHGFLLRFVFRPFGHVAMGCSREPGLRTSPSDLKVVIDDFEFSLDDFHFLPSGVVYFRGERPTSCRITNADIAILGQTEAVRLKKHEAEMGVVSAEDALYWSLEALRGNRSFSEAVAQRFDEIIVDEAQDTSSIQIECLRAIRASGLQSLFLVGDFDQSIYSFQGASPEGCRALAVDCGLRAVRLAENHRSSQLICNVAATLRPEGQPDVAVGPNRDFPVSPSYFLYGPENLASLSNQFALRVQEHGGILRESAVLARTQGLVRALSGGPRMQLSGKSPIWGLLRAAGDRDRALELSGVQNVERLLTAVAGDGEEVLEALESTALRTGAMRVIEGMPEAEGSLEAWLDTTTAVVVEVARDLGAADLSVVEELLRVPDRYLSMDARDAVPVGRADGMLIETVHGVKGMSLDAVLLVANPVDNFRGYEAHAWAAIWDALRRGLPVGSFDAEEARVLYVALTRARRFCEVALPDSTAPQVLGVFEAAGVRPAN